LVVSGARGAVEAARRRERAVLALLRGAEAPQVIAARCGVTLDELFEWLERYREGGRRELGG
jgi:transposase